MNPATILSALGNIAGAFRAWTIRRGGICEAEKDACERDLQLAREEIAMLQSQLNVARRDPPTADGVLEAVRNGGL